MFWSTAILWSFSQWIQDWFAFRFLYFQPGSVRFQPSSTPWEWCVDLLDKPHEQACKMWNIRVNQQHHQFWSLTLSPKQYVQYTSVFNKMFSEEKKTSEVLQQSGHIGEKFWGIWGIIEISYFCKSCLSWKVFDCTISFRVDSISWKNSGGIVLV